MYRHSNGSSSDHNHHPNPHLPHPHHQMRGNHHHHSARNFDYDTRPHHHHPQNHYSSSSSYQERLPVRTDHRRTSNPEQSANSPPLSPPPPSSKQPTHGSTNDQCLNPSSTNNPKSNNAPATTSNNPSEARQPNRTVSSSSNPTRKQQPITPPRPHSASATRSAAADPTPSGNHDRNSNIISRSAPIHQSQSLEDHRPRTHDDHNRDMSSSTSRRSNEFPSRSGSARYNPYPPSAPRADSHPSSLTRIPPPTGPSSYSSYHSSSHSGSHHHHHHHHHGHHHPSAYDDRLPRSHHDHSFGPPHRVFDPNSQFNHGPPKDKSPPSQSVIFMGLPIHTDESNLKAFLEQNGASVESVTIIYDRITGQSKRYGFARFTSIEHARAFVEPSFPMLVWKEPTGSRFDRSGDGLKVKIDYSQKEKVPFEPRQRERESHNGPHPSNELTSHESSFQPNHSSSESSLTTTGSINDGARDIGGTPTSILLLRGLDPNSTEQEIAQHLQHIPDPSQTVLPGSIRRVMLIKDRASRSSWGYAFVQLADLQVAVKALSLLLNTSLFPRGFQIRSRTITVTFAHEHSFHPVYTPSDWSFRGAGGQELAYWDDKAYAAVYMSPLPISDNEQARKSSSLSPPKREKTVESNGSRPSADKNHGVADSSNNEQSNTHPLSKSATDHSHVKHTADPDKNLHEAEPQTQLDAPVNTPSKKRSNSREASNPLNTISNQAEDQVLSKLNNNSSNNDSGGAQDQLLKEAKIEKKKNGAEPIATKKMVANIQKWNSKHQEISNPNHTEEVQQESNSTQEAGSANEDDYSDFNRMTCLLCQRQFKSVEDLSRHNSLSNLHKGNLQSDKLRRAAKLRKAASLRAGANNVKKITSSNNENPSANNNQETNLLTGTKTTTVMTTTATVTATTMAAPAAPKYTDRAAARREVYGQPDAPDSDKHQAKKARYEPAPLPPQPPAQPDKDGIQSTNVGSKMLEKMGWQKGEGLGNGNGRVEPIVASQYSKGVGLGASTGNLVGQYDDSKKGFIEKVKDKTIERFNSDKK